jgi:hypothetical protein
MSDVVRGYVAQVDTENEPMSEWFFWPTEGEAAAWEADQTLQSQQQLKPKPFTILPHKDGKVGLFNMFMTDTMNILVAYSERSPDFSRHDTEDLMEIAQALASLFEQEDGK